jgi:signal transduction histidine kinase
VSWFRANKVIVCAWLIFVGGYAVMHLAMPYGQHLTAFGDVAQCVVLLFTNAGLLLNAGSADWRRNAFWLLLATGCGLWLTGNLLWTYFEVILHQQVPTPFIGDVIVFVHTVPLIAALALRAHLPRPDRNLRVGNVDLVLLLCFWMYLYLFVVLPWQYVAPNEGLYTASYDKLYSIENLVLIGGLLYLSLTVKGGWRIVYLNLLGAASCYQISSMVINQAIARNVYRTGSLYDVGLIAAFVWYGTTGFIARRVCPRASVAAEEPSPDELPSENAWPARLAIAATISLPAIAIWSQLASDAPLKVRQFRLIATLVAIVVFTSLVFLRQALVDQDRMRLLRGSQASFRNLKRIQNQFIQSEKLASLGQLAAGAAHEINNPLTAILGYSDVMIEDGTASDNSRRLAEKIREQARRTKALVTKLISFAQPVPAERTLLDVNTILSSALELRRLDLMGKNIRIDLDAKSNLPGVNGDANQLLQVFFNIISNAVDALEEVGGGALTVHTSRETTNVIIEFSDTGPGIKEPHLVFDPFYTTKPAGKGTGLGLSICYGLVKEHGGQISCFNRPGGGATFRIELPAVLALFPVRDSAKPHSAFSNRLSSPRQ